MGKKSAENKGTQSRPNATGDASKAVGDKLHALYESVMDEGIPERFIELLEKLDRAERAQGASDGEESESKR